MIKPQTPNDDKIARRSIHSLTEDQHEKLHEASLEILPRTGARFYDEGGLNLFKRAGAEISDGNLVKIPYALVEWAITTAPKDIPIFDQTGRQTMSLGGYRSYFGVGSDCMCIYDIIKL